MQAIVTHQSWRRILLILVFCACPLHAMAAALELEVVTVSDEGEGSLRAALETAASAGERPVRIHFGPRDGLFSTPQTIQLTAPLPMIIGEVTIDGFIPNLLWRAYGATISGSDTHRIFEVAESGTLRLTGVTLRSGRAPSGGAVLNHGRLDIEGVSLLENSAASDGGAIANHGELWVINSTLAWNRSSRGGGLANLAGQARLINTTLHQNAAPQGAALWSQSQLHLAKSSLSGAPDQSQCINSGRLSEQTTHNLIQGAHTGCGEPILTIDPGLEDRLGYFNGPTPTIPVGGASPVVNLGLNAAAVDARGEPLRWDQRGNGDPRFASGHTDLGAFERQGHLPDQFVVDTIEDTGLRACSLSAAADCPLRAALELATAARQATPIRFDARIFDEPRTIILSHIPALGNQAVVLDGSGTAGVTIIVPEAHPWETRNGVRVEVRPAVQARQP